MQDKKLVFHLPRFRVEAGQLIAIDYYDLRGSFIDKIQKCQPAYVLSEIKKILTSNYEYDVELITVYTTDEHQNEICKAFLDTVCKFSKLSTEIEKYHYEIDDLFICVVVGKQESDDAEVI